jgi:hypothetical protein
MTLQQIPKCFHRLNIIINNNVSLGMPKKIPCRKSKKEQFDALSKQANTLHFFTSPVTEHNGGILRSLKKAQKEGLNVHISEKMLLKLT